MDENNHFIYSTPEYEVVNLYQDKVCIKSSDSLLYGLADIDGSIIIEPQYLSPLEFTEEMAAVEKNKKIGYISDKGELVIDYNYDWGMPFSEIKIPNGYTVDSSLQRGFDNFYHGDLIIVFNDSKRVYSAMDKQGNIVIEFKYAEEVKIFNKNYVAVKIDGKWGIVDVYLK